MSARNLSRQPEKATALALLERANAIERGAARSLQRGLQPVERRAQAGRGADHLAQDVERRREATAIAPAMERIGEAVERQAQAMEPLQEIKPRIDRAVSPPWRRQAGPEEGCAPRARSPGPHQRAEGRGFPDTPDRPVGQASTRTARASVRSTREDAELPRR